MKAIESVSVVLDSEATKKTFQFSMLKYLLPFLDHLFVPVHRLWLFSYHNETYSKTFEDLSNLILEIEGAKLAIAPYSVEMGLKS